MKTPLFDGGSFRDRESRVFYSGERVLRALSQPACDDWRVFASSKCFERSALEHQIVTTTELESPSLELEGLDPNWVAVLEHERIPFVSYPYEWSFTMLKDAALLHLELLVSALRDDLILKDSSAYNVQWIGSRPVFIDITSFEKRTEGDPWVGYLQFCQLFLYPLFLTAYKDVSFRPWLRGAIDGIQPEEATRMFSWRDRLRPGVLTDVVLQAALHARTADSDRELRGDLRRAGFKKELIVHNIQRLRKIVGKLEWRRTASEWSAYAVSSSYDDQNLEIKKQFVARAAATRHWQLVWDLGANVGEFSKIAAEHADLVVAFDADHLAVDILYQRLRENGPENILPLVSNLADPSPALGWRHRERKSLGERPTPELTLCLALIHHLSITANLPLDEIVEWLGSLGTSLVIEFVTKEDAMVKRLLQNKDDIYIDYDREVFERLLAERFEIIDRKDLHSGTRTLYFARPST